MVLPGIRATIERRANDKLIVTKLEISDAYDSLKKGRNKPGIYEVEHEGGDNYETKYKANGWTAAVDDRTVVVCDGN